MEQNLCHSMKSEILSLFVTNPDISGQVVTKSQPSMQTRRHPAIFSYLCAGDRSARQPERYLPGMPNLQTPPMEQTLFRSATPADVPRILQIIRQAQRRMAAAGSLQWQDGYPAPGNIDDDLKHRYGHVITREGASGEPTVIAYGAIVFDGEPAYEALDGAWLTRGDYVVVHRLAVADEALGNGIGREFLKQTEQLARERGIRAFRIDTNFDNRRMLRILAQTGFVRCGKVVYRSGEREAFEKVL